MKVLTKPFARYSYGVESSTGIAPIKTSDWQAWLHLLN